MRRAVFPGSFDPVTLGHLHLIERASRLYDEVIVVIGANSQKNALFSVEERQCAVDRMSSIGCKCAGWMSQRVYWWIK